MNPLTKKKEYARARAYIQENPNCTYDELLKDLGITGLTKGYFHTMRTGIRKKGAIPKQKPFKTVEAGNDIDKKSQLVQGSNSVGIRIEILETIDATDFSEDLRSHWKSTLLPMFQKHFPNGKDVTLVFLADPPMIEIRKIVR